jgi:hypothetical protein
MSALPRRDQRFCYSLPTLYIRSFDDIDSRLESSAQDLIVVDRLVDRNQCLGMVDKPSQLML